MRLTIIFPDYNIVAVEEICLWSDMGRKSIEIELKEIALYCLQARSRCTARLAELCKSLRPVKLFSQRMFEALRRSSWLAVVRVAPFQTLCFRAASHWWMLIAPTGTSVIRASFSALMTRTINRSSISTQPSSFTRTRSTPTSTLWSLSTFLIITWRRTLTDALGLYRGTTLPTTTIQQVSEFTIITRPVSTKSNHQIKFIKSRRTKLVTNTNSSTTRVYSIIKSNAKKVK